MGVTDPGEIVNCAAYAASKGVPYLSTGVGQDGLTGRASYFATSQTYAQQHPALVSYITHALHKTKLAIVVDNTAGLKETQTSIT
jgi:ABC-type branched-subunit amino acid transport system substrate-binding protein